MKYLQAENSDVGTSRRPSDGETSPPNSKRQRVLLLNTLSFILFFPMGLNYVTSQF
jgi:hypothetical protein